MKLLVRGNEEGWVLLPSGKILSIAIKSGTNSELYNPATDTWSSAGSTGVPLWDSALKETGASILRPDVCICLLLLLLSYYYFCVKLYFYYT